VAKVMAMFDHVVESSVVGVRKPEPAFYRKALAIIGIGAAEAVFLDDLGINLKPARVMGMTTIKVVDPDLALGELGRLLGVDLHR
jgi:putative hydrolase of the HAD superfamily